jgi:hypothetical protein
MIPLPLISAVGGAAVGLFQTFVEKHGDSKKEIAIAKINAEKEVAMASHNAVISQNQLQTQESSTEQEQSKTEASVRQSEASEYQVFAETIQETSKPLEGSSSWVNFANCYASTVRPSVTYTLLILVCFMSILLMTTETITDNQITIFEYILYHFDAVIGYWFVRRDISKSIVPQFIPSKKKLI